MQFIRDNQGRVIGHLQVLSDGKRRIFSANGILLGWYDPASDKTTDAKSGNWMGFGDQTLLLLCR